MSIAVLNILGRGGKGGGVIQILSRNFSPFATRNHLIAPGEKALGRSDGRTFGRSDGPILKQKK